MSQSHPRLRAGLAACALLLAIGGTARAQYAFDDEIMPPRVVALRLADRGFTGISRPRFDGRAYVVEASNPNGARIRLFVDAQDGAILGRQRLEAGPIAIARPAPGYGWTEDDEPPRRPMLRAERLLPPADIPMPESRGMPLRRPLDPQTGPFRSDGPTGSPGRAAADPNPLGGNPDRRGRAEPPRKLARVGNPAKLPEAKAVDGKAQPRAVPEAPKLRPVEAAQPEAKPQVPVATADRPKPAPLPGVTQTPAAVQPPSDGTVARSPDATASETKSAEMKSAETKGTGTKAGERSWKDPPESKRNVRVIGGATLVPGAPEKEQTPQ